MKYTITNNRLKEIMEDYLNKIAHDSEATEDDKTIRFYYDNEEDDNFGGLIFFYNKELNFLSLDSEMVSYFSKLFPPNRKESQHFIGDWFSNKFGVTVESVLSL